MKKVGRVISLFLSFVLLVMGSASAQTVSFSSGTLAGETLTQPTSLQFGPDGRLYVAEQFGKILIYTVVRNGTNNYQITATETVMLIQQIPNHNDDGAQNAAVNTRQVTGIVVAGTAANPVIYVTSSDPRIGGGNGTNNDKNLDTNSGIISRLTWNGSSWVKLDLVRGLPRSEENHSPNGLAYDKVNNVLYMAQGGNTNMGAPSNNFAYLPEYAYSTAILKIDLSAIGNSTYDLPTLDDETRSNVSGNDVNDPFGGNDGLNQGRLVAGGPVSIYSPGWRNNYDIVITQAGRMYSFDNGPNGGWGGPPVSCSIQNSEPGSTYCDGLHYVSSQGYYAGFPNPVRANRSITFNATNPQTPIPAGMENPAECNYIVPGSNGTLTTICSSTNGMCEYTASNFSNSMKGNLLAVSFNGKLYRFKLNAAGNAIVSGGQTILAQNFGSTPLDVIAQGDNDVFPGTIWVAMYGANDIMVFEPNDFTSCNGDPNSMTLDDDGDGFSNGDETQNLTDKCSPASVPADFDGDKLSDLLDSDDDNDGLSDSVDLFAQDANNGTTTTIPVHFAYQNANNGGIGGWGFTGLMCNSVDDYMNLYNMDDMTVGGAAYKFTVDNVPPNDALGATNNQKFAYQLGVNVGAFGYNYVVSSRVMGPFAGITPADFRSMGMFMGTGDQDNYLKMVCAANGGAGGIEIVKEVAGVATSTMYSLPILGSTHVNLYLTVNASTQMVQPSYSIGGGAVADLGPAISVPASWLSNVLAVGFISTSRGATPFSATWDFIAVEPVPGTGQWYSVTNTNNCTARMENAFVQAGDKFILLGGRGTVPAESYNYTTKTWTAGANPPMQLHHFQAVEMNGLIYVVGAFTGNYPNETPVPNVYIYDPVANVWHVGMDIPAARRRGSAGAVAYNGKIYLVSGLTNGHVSGWVPYLDEFNPATNTWTALPDAPQARDHFHVAIHDGKIYCAGGRNSGYGGSTFAHTIAQTDIYDIATQTWSTLPSPQGDIPTQRAGASVVTLGDEIVVIGGESMSQNSGHNQTEALDCSTNQWRTLDNLIQGRHATQAIANNNGIYTVCGSSIRGSSPLNSMEAFYYYGQTTPTGTAINKGALALSPASHNFGQLPVGNSQSASFTLSNPNGNQAILIKSISLPSTDFSFTSPVTAPFVLAPGSSVTLSVTFLPVSGGTKNATLTIAHTGSNGVNSTISLTGIGLGPQAAIRINCGGPQYTATNGDVFSADAYYSSGTFTTSTTQAINGTTEDALYQTERYNTTFSYDIPVQNGTYSVILHFAEIWSGGNAAGKRVFDVKIENSLVLDDFDIFSVAGQYTAVARTFTVSVSDQTLNIDFAASINKGKISAIEIIPASSIEFTLSGNVNVNEDFSGTQTVSVTPQVPNQQVSYSLSPASVSFANVSIDSTTGLVSIASVANGNGTQQFTVTATDLTALNAPYSQTFMLTVNPVNDAPAFTLSGNVTVNEDFAGTQTVSVTPGTVPADEVAQTVSYSLSPSSVSFANVSINSATGEVSITSVANKSGAQVFTITADDGQASNNTSSKTFTLTVNPVNDAPAFTLSGNVTVNEDFAGTQTVSVTPGTVPADEVAQTVSYSLSPSSVSFTNVSINSATGEVTITSIADASGSQLFTITADDAQSANNTYSQTFTLSVNPVNDEPAFTLSGDVTVNEDFAGTQTVSVTPGAVPADEMSQTVSYSIIPSSVSFANVSISSATGEVSITAVANKSGTQVFTITADDGQASNNTFSKTFTLTVNSMNDAPTLDAISDIIIDEDAGTQTVNLSGISAGGNEIQTLSVTAVSDNISLIPNPSVNYTSANASGSISFAPVANKNGVANITVTVDDSGLLFSRTFTVTVNPVNDAPAFTLSGNVTVNEDFAGTQTVSVTPGAVPADEMSQTVSYSISPSSVSFAYVSINSATGEVTISSVADASGSQLFTVTADDAQSTNNIYSQTFTLTVNPVNDAPAFTLSGDVTVNEDFAGTQTVSVTPGAVPADEMSQTVSYSISPSSVNFANVSISSATGEVSITAVAGKSGTQVFTVTADDGQSSNNTFSKTFTLTVNSMNDAPTLDAISDITIDEDAGTQTVNLSGISAGGNEIQTLSVTAVSDNISLIPNPSVNYTSANASGSISFAPVANKNGAANIIVTVDDSGLTFSRTFTVTVNPVNDEPAFTLSGDVTVNEDFAGTQTVSVTPGTVPADEMSQTVSYNLSPASVSFANVSINSATGEVSVNAVADKSGTQVFTVTADDGQASNNTSSKTFTLTVNPVNDTPAFTLSGDVTVNEDFAGTQTVSVTPGAIPADEMSQTVSYSISPASVSFANVSINSATGEITITSIADASGSQLFTITADDAQSANNTYSQTFTLSVNPVNDEPAFTLSGDVTVNEDFSGTRTVSVTPGTVPADEVAQTVSYSISPASVSFANVSINNATGEVTITSVADASGSQLFTVTADDSHSQNNTYSQTFTLTINPVNDAPVFTLSGDVMVNEDFAGTQTVSVTPGTVPADEVAQTVSYSISPASVSFANVSINSATGEITITSIADASGSQQFTVTADDAQSANNTYSQTFTLTVNPINDAPAFTLSGDVSVNEDFSGTQTVSVTPGAIPADEVAQTVSYSLSPASVSFANVSINSATGEVTISSIADASGSQLFTVAADDEQSQNNTYLQTFTLTVDSVNDQPTLDAVANPGSVLEDSGLRTISLSGISAGGSEYQTLSLTVSSDNPSLFATLSAVYTSPNSTGTLQFQPAPNMWGAATVTVTVDDGQAMNNRISRSFLISVASVNDAPKFVLSSNTLTLDEDFSGAQNISVIPSAVPADEIAQTVTYSLSPMSVPFANISFNNTTGEMQITAVANASGSRTFTILANDGQSQNNTFVQTLVLTINPVNDAPVFAVNSPATVYKNFTAAQVVTVTPSPVPADETGQTVVYNLTPATVNFANISFNSATGTATITSMNNMVGAQMFTVTADDGQSANNLHSEQFLFSVVDTNYQPTLDALADLTIDEDAGMQFINLSGITPGFNENQPLTLSAVSDNPALIANPVIIYSNPDTAGILEFAPISNQSGVAVITVKADDGQNLNNFITRSFTVTVNPVNDAPSLDAIADITVNEDAGAQTIVLTGISSGPGEQQSVSVSAVSDNPSLIANPVITYNNPDVSGLLQFAPAPEQNGSAVITVTLDDGQASNNIITRTFTVIVLPVNDAPVISDVFKNGQEDTNIAFTAGNFTASFADIDGDTLTKIQIRTLPANGSLTLHLNPVNLLDEITASDISGLVYHPAGEFSGADGFEWNGFDGQSYGAMNAAVHLNLQAVNDTPYVTSHIPDITVNEDAVPLLNYADLRNIFSDIEDGSNLTCTIVNSNTALLNAVIDTDHTLDISFMANAHGSATLIVTATDQQGAFISDTFNVTVNSVDDIPGAFNLLTPANGSIINPANIEFTWENSTDGDNDPITYSINVKGTGLDTTITGISANSLLFDGSILKHGSTYQWFILASDGDDFTVSQTFTFKVQEGTGIENVNACMHDILAYPNPFNTQFAINYTLNTEAKVRVTIYDYLGQVVNIPMPEKQTSGKHRFEWKGASAIAAGVYFYEITVIRNDNSTATFSGKMVKE